MRTSLAAALFAVAAAVLGLTGLAWAQQQRWAAVDSNREVSAPVAWGTSEAQAKARAIEACEKVSKTCANGPAVTSEMDDVFAVMCCSRPKFGCAIAAADSREDAVAGVRKTLVDGGYSNCTLRHHLSAGSGKKQ